jgi:hypothetical protein
MKPTHNQFIGIYENAIPLEYCNEVIDIFNSNPNFHKNRQQSDGVSSIKKKDNFMYLGEASTYHEQIFSNLFFDHILSTYSLEYGSVEMMAGELGLNDYKIQKTLPGEGYHVWHFEQGSNIQTVCRVAAYTLYLNDVEEGGETEFLYQHKRIPPKAGTIVLFPAAYTHTHRGNPPLSGEKYIMTGWLVYKEIFEGYHIWNPSSSEPPKKLNL